MDRRDFIKSAAMFSAAGAVLGTGLPLVHTAQPGKRPSAMDPKTIPGYKPEMQYRPHGNTGVHVSALGFGMLRLPMLEDRRTVDEAQSIEMLRYGIDNGINYVDTARGYLGGQSEAVVGKALLNGYRDKVYLATKSTLMAMNSEADFERMFDESRKQLQTDVIDYYLLHHVTSKTWNESVLAFKVLDKIERYKQDGKIRFSGFSFHDNLALFKRVIEANPAWDFCQIILNYLDTEYEAGYLGMKYAHERGIAVNCMQPLKAGFMASPPKNVQAVFNAAPTKKTALEWAFDYLWNLPEADLVISGMSNLDQAKENLEYARRSSVGKLGLADLMVITQAAKSYRAIDGVTACAGCNNCASACPKKVAIGSLIGQVWFNYKVSGNKAAAVGSYRNVPAPRGVNADACDGCGQCLPKCPYGVDIPGVLREMRYELKA